MAPFFVPPMPLLVIINRMKSTEEFSCLRYSGQRRTDDSAQESHKKQISQQQALLSLQPD
jgi:hypothetical protein